MTLLPHISIHVSQKADTPPLWRVLHDRELPSGVRDEVIARGVPLPEVFQLQPANHFTRLTYDWQWLWKNLNPNMTGAEWRKLAACHRFGTNDHGFDCSQKPPHGPFADFVNGKDVGAELPKIEAILCGGAIITGKETIERGEPVLLVETLDGTKAPPSVGWVMERSWLWYEAISVRPDGGTQSFSITSGPEYVPIVASVPVTFPMSGLVRV